MVTNNELIGVWVSPPGGHQDVTLTFLDDGSGIFRFHSLNESESCRFVWKLSDSGGKISFAAMGPTVRNCYLLGKEYLLTFTPQVNDFGFMRDMLTMTSWQDALVLEVEGKMVQFAPAQWGNAYYFRQAHASTE